MYTRQLPSPEFLRKLLRYEPLTGKLFWRERAPEMFASRGNGGRQGSANRWNARWANKEAFTNLDSHGYPRGSILAKQYRAHRVIWAMETGAWPVDQIDHDDHDRANNRFKNLCEATRAENMKNRSMSPNNTSGVNGVSWNKKTEKWAAYITVDYLTIGLGRFNDKSDAIAARQAANKKYNFHKNHGV